MPCFFMAVSTSMPILGEMIRFTTSTWTRLGAGGLWTFQLKFAGLLGDIFQLPVALARLVVGTHFDDPPASLPRKVRREVSWGKASRSGKVEALRTLAIFHKHQKWAAFQPLCFRNLYECRSEKPTFWWKPTQFAGQNTELYNFSILPHSMVISTIKWEHSQKAEGLSWKYTRLTHVFYTSLHEYWEKYIHMSHWIPLDPIKPHWITISNGWSNEVSFVIGLAPRVIHRLFQSPHHLRSRFRLERGTNEFEKHGECRLSNSFSQWKPGAKLPCFVWINPWLRVSIVDQHGLKRWLVLINVNHGVVNGKWSSTMVNNSLVLIMEESMENPPLFLKPMSTAYCYTPAQAQLET